MMMMHTFNIWTSFNANALSSSFTVSIGISFRMYSFFVLIFEHRKTVPYAPLPINENNLIYLTFDIFKRHTVFTCIRTRNSDRNDLHRKMKLRSLILNVSSLKTWVLSGLTGVQIGQGCWSVDHSIREILRPEVATVANIPSNLPMIDSFWYPSIFSSI